MQRNNAIANFFLFVAFISAIEYILKIANVPSYIFPSPLDIILSIKNQINTAIFSWAVTASEAFGGLGISVAISTLLAFSTIFLPNSISKAINTFGIAIQSTPLLAVAPLLSLWLGQTFASKVAAACVVCFFPLLTGWLSGIRSVEPEHLQLFENFGANNIQRLLYLLIPTSLPFFFNGLRIAMPLALLGAIVGEFVGASEGIGFQILTNSYYVRTPLMFAYVIIAALTGLGFTMIISAIEHKLLFWHGKDRKA